MSLVFYAIAECSEGEVDGHGLEGRPLKGVAEGELVAVVSERSTRHLDQESAILWEYERTVETLMRQHPILPARFGSVFDAEDDVRSMMRERSAELRAAVARVRDAAELGLRASWSSLPEGGKSDESGTAYMHRRLAQHRRAEHVARVLEPLDRLARASHHRLQPDAATAFAGAYLIERDRLEEFTQLVRDLDQRLEDIGLLLTGPWPPYSFAQGAGP
jgi:Gas vesicle synthesis protein GvpL/GvpF